MKLTDLLPHWVNIPNAAPGVHLYLGVSFLCPTMEHTPCPTCGHQRGKRIAVSFWPPIDPDNLIEKLGITYPHDHFHHRVSGDTFDTLTLSPSVGLEPYWHGHIIDGEIK